MKIDATLSPPVVFVTKHLATRGIVAAELVEVCGENAVVRFIEDGTCEIVHRNDWCRTRQQALTRTRTIEPVFASL